MWYACVCVCVHDVLKRERDGDEVYRDGRRERGGGEGGRESETNKP